jgi:hypothetical protein
MSISSTKTGIDRIEALALALSRRSPNRSCGLPLQSRPVTCADETLGGLIHGYGMAA